jgi:hypothetical protein
MSDVEKENNMAANQNGSYAGKVAFVTGAGAASAARQRWRLHARVPA